MKIGTLGVGVLAIVLAAGVSMPSVGAQSQSPQANQEQTTGKKTGTFVGQIVKVKSGQYALLTDKEGGKGYYLDDQSKAKEFAGQNVKVMGTLDIASSTIHVSDIQPA